MATQRDHLHEIPTRNKRDTERWNPKRLRSIIYRSKQGILQKDVRSNQDDVETFRSPSPAWIIDKRQEEYFKSLLRSIIRKKMEERGMLRKSFTIPVTVPFVIESLKRTAPPTNVRMDFQENLLQRPLDYGKKPLTEDHAALRNDRYRLREDEFSQYDETDTDDDDSQESVLQTDTATQNVSDEAPIEMPAKHSRGIRDSEKRELSILSEKPQQNIVLVNQKVIKNQVNFRPKLSMFNASMKKENLGWNLYPRLKSVQTAGKPTVPIVEETMHLGAHPFPPRILSYWSKANRNYKAHSGKLPNFQFSPDAEGYQFFIARRQKFSEFDGGQNTLQSEGEKNSADDEDLNSEENGVLGSDEYEGDSKTADENRFLLSDVPKNKGVPGTEPVFSLASEVELLSAYKLNEARRIKPNFLREFSGNGNILKPTKKLHSSLRERELKRKGTSELHKRASDPHKLESLAHIGNELEHNSLDYLSVISEPTSRWTAEDSNMDVTALSVAITAVLIMGFILTVYFALRWRPDRRRVAPKDETRKATQMRNKPSKNRRQVADKNESRSCEELSKPPKRSQSKTPEENVLEVQAPLALDQGKQQNSILNLQNRNSKGTDQEINNLCMKWIKNGKRRRGKVKHLDRKLLLKVRKAKMSRHSEIKRQDENGEERNYSTGQNNELDRPLQNTLIPENWENSLSSSSSEVTSVFRLVEPSIKNETSAGISYNNIDVNKGSWGTNQPPSSGPPPEAEDKLEKQDRHQQKQLYRELELPPVFEYVTGALSNLTNLHYDIEMKEGIIITKVDPFKLTFMDGRSSLESTSQPEKGDAG